MTRLTAAAVTVVLAALLLPGTASAAGLDQAFTTDLVDGILEQSRSTPYSQAGQFVPQSQNLEIYSRSRSAGSAQVDSVVRYPGTLEVSKVDLNSLWHCPLEVETFVSSPFGMRRHPVYGSYRMHEGVDLDSERGDLVLAARGGTVIKVAYSYAAGRYVRIDHGDGFITDYYHLSSQLVEEGQQVYGGQPIGKVGSTGVSTGSHLHFGIKLNDEWVDPEDYINFN